MPARVGMGGRPLGRRARRAGGCAELRAGRGAAACRRGAGPRAAGGASRSRCRHAERRDCDAQPGWTWAQAPGKAVGGLGAAVAAVGERCCPPPAAGGAR